MRFKQSTHAFGVSLIALGLGLGFSHAAMASKFGGHYKVTQICKVAERGASPVNGNGNGNGNGPVVETIGTVVNFHAKIEQLEPLDVDGVAQVVLGMVSHDGKKKIFYYGNVDEDTPMRALDNRFAPIPVNINVTQCYGIKDHHLLVSDTAETISFAGTANNFFGEGSTFDRWHDGVDVPKDFTCTYVLTRTNNKNTKLALHTKLPPKPHVCDVLSGMAPLQ